MTFWDKAKKALDQAATSVDREAKSLGKHYEIGKLEEELERQFAEMGRRARDLYNQLELRDADIEVLVKRVRELEQLIDERRQAIHDLGISDDEATQE